jgi:hypothetical protein
MSRFNPPPRTKYQHIALCVNQLTKADTYKAGMGVCVNFLKSKHDEFSTRELRELGRCRDEDPSRLSLRIPVDGGVLLLMNAGAGVWIKLEGSSGCRGLNHFRSRAE